MRSSTWPRACGLLVAYSMNSTPFQAQAGSGPSTMASRSAGVALAGHWGWTCSWSAVCPVGMGSEEGEGSGRRSRGGVGATEEQDARCSDRTTIRWHGLCSTSRPDSSAIASSEILQCALDILLHHQHRGALARRVCATAGTRPAPPGATTRWTVHRSAAPWGAAASARPISSCFCSPPESAEAWLCMRCLHPRKELQHLGNALMGGLHAQRDAAELHVLVDGELPEQVASLRHEGDAHGQQFAFCAAPPTSCPSSRIPDPGAA